MNFVAEYFFRRSYRRVARLVVIYGSSHTQLSVRHKWNPLRLILGPFKLKVFHPKDAACKCNWKDVPNGVNNALDRWK